MSYPIYEAPVLQQSWYFDCNPPDNPNPTPIVEQCGSIPITWGRGYATGPNPHLPVYLKIFTSHKNAPLNVPFGEGFTRNYVVPFPAGTQFQICMIDSVGNTGGCQGIWSVYPSPSGQPNCTDATFPMPLDVTTGMSQFSRPDQCSLIQFGQFGGIPPYTFFAAPSLRPPTLITDINSTGLQWRVPYDHGTPFFVNIEDSKGRVWSRGPMHAGDSETAVTSCLDYKHTSSKKVYVPVGALAGATVGALILGMILSFGVLHWWTNRRKQRGESNGIQQVVGRGLPAQPIPFEITQQQVEAQHNRQSGHLTNPVSEVQPRQNFGPSTTNQRHRHRTIGSITSRRTSITSSGITSPSEKSDISRYYITSNPEDRGSRKLPRTPSRGRSPGRAENVMKSKESLVIQSRKRSSDTDRTATPRSNSVTQISAERGKSPASIATDQDTRVVETPPGYSRSPNVASNQTPASVIPRRGTHVRPSGAAAPTSSFFLYDDDGDRPI